MYFILERNFTIPTPFPYDWYSPSGIKLSRRVSKEDIEKMNLKMVPGFNITWSYSGPGAGDQQKYGYKAWNYDNTLAFVR